MTSADLLAAVGASLAAGAPAAALVWRNAVRILAAFDRGTTALDRIADRLDEAHTVTFRKPAGPRLLDESEGVE